MSLKRIYSAPEIHIHSLDREICLVMASVPGDPGGGGDPFGAPAPAPMSPSESSGLKSTSYPFGGDAPDYSNM